MPTQKETPASNLLQAFKAFDVNGDGYISKAELKEGLEILGEAITEAELNELIEQIDGDNDGQIHYAGTGTYIIYFLRADVTATFLCNMGNHGF